MRGLKDVALLLSSSILLIIAYGVGGCTTVTEPSAATGDSTQSQRHAEEGDLRLTICYDNNPHAEGLVARWGFSCLVEGTEKTILFDVGGEGSVLLSNMEELGIDPRVVDGVVLSHIHNDHIGGLDRFLVHRLVKTCTAIWPLVGRYRSSGMV